MKKLRFCAISKRHGAKLPHYREHLLRRRPEARKNFNSALQRQRDAYFIRNVRSENAQSLARSNVDVSKSNFGYLATISTPYTSEKLDAFDLMRSENVWE